MSARAEGHRCYGFGHSVLFKLRRRTLETTHFEIRLDHGDLLVMDGLTQIEYEHSTSSELLGPRVNFAWRWMSQHIKSCPLVGLLYRRVRKVWLSRTPVVVGWRK